MLTEIERLQAVTHGQKYFLGTTSPRHNLSTVLLNDDRFNLKTKLFPDYCMPADRRNLEEKLKNVVADSIN